jgi:hypothetical protein
MGVEHVLLFLFFLFLVPGWNIEFFGREDGPETPLS